MTDCSRELSSRDTKAKRAEGVSTAVQQRLRASNYWHLRQLLCEGNGATVSVAGKVPNFHLKQIAQKLVYQTDGVEHMIDRIEVIAPD